MTTTQQRHLRRHEGRPPSSGGRLLPDERRHRAPFDPVSSVLWAVVAVISSAWLVVLAFAVRYALA
jgi:hypothetical protein